MDFWYLFLITYFGLSYLFIIAYEIWCKVSKTFKNHTTTESNFSHLFFTPRVQYSYCFYLAIPSERLHNQLKLKILWMLKDLINQKNHAGSWFFASTTIDKNINCTCLCSINLLLYKIYLLYRYEVLHFWYKLYKKISLIFYFE